jgi:hypothetical protein
MSREEITQTIFRKRNSIENNKSNNRVEYIQLGDECQIQDGIFEVRSIVNRSARNNATLKNTFLTLI